MVTPASRPNAGSDQYICNNTTATLSAGNISNAASVSWRDINNTSALITSSSTATTTVTNLQVGSNYAFEFTLNGLGTCPATKDTVALFVRPLVTQASIQGPDTVLICGYVRGNGLATY
ncbi:MAG TPA: hypothetical protein DCQ29_04115, partial [Chitinophagaceae bacterium]|nr:hypothetical protein [Chitinophagaceae bacterium]